MVHFHISKVFVIEYGLGTQGTGYAACLTNSSMLIIVVIYANCLEEVQKMNQGIDWFGQVLKWQGLKEYVEIAIPMMLMLISEWWAYEFITIMTGYVGVKA